MTEPTARPRVRPAFRWLAVVAFVLLLPFAVGAVWDYVENTRYQEAVHRIQMKGEPTRSPDGPPAWDTDAGSRYYRAAGALASNFHTDARLPLRALTTSMQKDEWAEGSLESLRSALAPYDEAMALADRAGDLPFDEFRAGTSYNYRTADLFAVQEVAGYRAIFRALNHDADGAVNSLYTEARAARTLGSFSLSQRMPRPLILAQVLERVQPSGAALARLAKAMAELDDDKEIAHWFGEIRRSALTGGWQNVDLGRFETVVTVLGLRHPAAMHKINKNVSIFTAIVDASHGPWPGRIDAVSAIDDTGVWPVNSGRRFAARLTTDIASQIAGFRSLRIVVAVEQYRRDHGEQLPSAISDLAPAYLASVPVDPFSGGSLILKRETNGYSIYSVGMNRKNDGGAEVNLPFVGTFPKEHPADVGVRVQYR